MCPSAEKNSTSLILKEWDTVTQHLYLTKKLLQPHRAETQNHRTKSIMPKIKCLKNHPNLNLYRCVLWCNKRGPRKLLSIINYLKGKVTKRVKEHKHQRKRKNKPKTTDKELNSLNDKILSDRSKMIKGKFTFIWLIEHLTDLIVWSKKVYFKSEQYNKYNFLLWKYWNSCDSVICGFRHNTK